MLYSNSMKIFNPEVSTKESENILFRELPKEWDIFKVQSEMDRLRDGFPDKEFSVDRDNRVWEVQR